MSGLKWFSFLMLLVAPYSYSQGNKTTRSWDDNWGGSINLKTVVGKSFGLNLIENTKSHGKYTLVYAPAWVQLTENGVLFGIPQKSDVGDFEIFFTVTENEKENSFRIFLSVSDTPAIPNKEYEVVANEVLKVDLRAATGLKGKYEYTGLPKWIHALETGVLVGMPETDDVGVTIAVVKVQGESSNDSFQVKITVKKPAGTTPPPQPNTTPNNPAVTPPVEHPETNEDPSEENTEEENTDGILQ